MTAKKSIAGRGADSAQTKTDQAEEARQASEAGEGEAGQDRKGAEAVKEQEAD